MTTTTICSSKSLHIGRTLIGATLAAVMAILPNSATAKPRTQAQMRQAALQQLTKGVRTAQAQSAAAQDLTLAVSYEGCAVYTMQGGGFAVVATDDVAPAILGYSDFAAAPDTTNQNFNWWLRAASSVVKAAAAEGRTIKRVTKPDTSRFKESVATLCTSRWDQEEPYWRLCPTGTKGRCLTGCVATAMSQVLYYHRGPLCGIGSRTIYYPYGNTSGTPVTANFSDDIYDWDNMLDTYTSGSYTTEQGDAVALLMRDCGVATNMQYDPDGSGAFHNEATTGLRQYFGIESAEYIERSNYTEKEWMEIIYDQISRNQPMVYGGDDRTYGGHSFVLDGYNADGQVHINWGWSGSDDGFFDIALLDPSYYKFTLNQDAIINIVPEPAVSLISDTVSLSEPGTLRAALQSDMIYRYDTLCVEGPINGTDLKTIRLMAGRDESGEKTNGTLRILDLTDATIKAGGESYLNDGGNALYLEQDSTLPRKAFFGCSVRTLLLPEGIKSIGTAALASTTRLDSILLRPAADADFIVKDNIIYSPDTTTILAALPRIAASTSIIDSCVTAVGPYAFSSRSQLTRLTLGKQLQTLGQGAFSGCGSLIEIKLVGKTPITINGAGCFEGVDKENCKLYVRAGSTTKFKAAAQWSDFKTMIEYGTTLKARNAMREYGDPNPRLGWSMSGDYVDGTPEVTCLADTLSPVGRYTIHIAPGTITDPAVDYEDGFLIVSQAPLTVGVCDTVREEGKENPTFTLTYSGLKNGETAAQAFTLLPECTTDADLQSKAGQYTIMPSGGEAPNYELSYTTGTLTVTEATDGIVDATIATPQSPQAIYTLSGQRIKEAISGKHIYIVAMPDGTTRRVVMDKH